MRGLRLARIAAQAELLRLRCLLRRQAIRALLAVVATVFLLGALAGAHVAAVLALMQRYTALTSVLIVVGVDLAIAVVLGLFAAGNGPGRAEREALRVRRVATEQAVEAVAVAGLIAGVRRVRSVRELFGFLVAAAVAVLFGSRR